MGVKDSWGFGLGLWGLLSLWLVAWWLLNRSILGLTVILLNGNFKRPLYLVWF